MTNANRFAVPLQVLDSVQVGLAQQVQDVAAPAQPYDARSWGGSVLPSGAEGGGGGCDADGD